MPTGRRHPRQLVFACISRYKKERSRVVAERYGLPRNTVLTMWRLARKRGELPPVDRKPRRE